MAHAAVVLIGKPLTNLGHLLPLLALFALGGLAPLALNQIKPVSEHATPPPFAPSSLTQEEAKCEQSMPSQSNDGRPREHQSFTHRGSCSLPAVAFLMAMGMLWRHMSDATRQAPWPSPAVSMMPPRARRQTHGCGLVRRMLPSLLLLLLLPACSGADFNERASTRPATM